MSEIHTCKKQSAASQSQQQITRSFSFSQISTALSPPIPHFCCISECKELSLFITEKERTHTSCERIMNSKQKIKTQKKLRGIQNRKKKQPQPQQTTSKNFQCEEKETLVKFFAMFNSLRFSATPTLHGTTPYCVTIQTFVLIFISTSIQHRNRPHFFLNIF